jgi:hypothetical protein
LVPLYWAMVQSSTGAGSSARSPAPSGASAEATCFDSGCLGRPGSGAGGGRWPAGASAAAPPHCCSCCLLCLNLQLQLRALTLQVFLTPVRDLTRLIKILTRFHPLDTLIRRGGGGRALKLAPRADQGRFGSVVPEKAVAHALARGVTPLGWLV